MIAATKQQDLCPYCVELLSESMNTLIAVIVDGGILVSCKDLCSYLDSTWQQILCNVVCDYVGLSKFIQFMEYADPDPIFICQVWELCPHVSGGAVNITDVEISPPAAEHGTIFVLIMEYTVLNHTSVGNIVYTVTPPIGYPYSSGEFTEGQDPGMYSVGWNLATNSSTEEPWFPGEYKVEFMVCAGDCSTDHPWGGIYDSKLTYFRITAKKR